MEDNESNRYEKIKFLGEGQVRLQAIELDTIELDTWSENVQI